MSDGVWPDVVSGVTVHVRELEDMAIHSSASLRLIGKLLKRDNIVLIYSTVYVMIRDYTLRKKGAV